MARQESKAIMGYLPIEAKHYAAILSLIAPATKEHRLLDPFAGEGAFLEAAAHAWQMSPYANELDHERAAACIQRFGSKNAVQGDAERLRASNHAFAVAWLNPPYDHDRVQGAGQKRVEFQMLRHSWKWLQDDGIALWAVYQQHISEAAASFFAKNARQVDVWALPGKHQGEYDQVLVVAIKGKASDEAALYESILEQRQAPRLLTLQSEALYRVPAPARIANFLFSADIVDEEMGARLIAQEGAWCNQGFQRQLQIPPAIEQIQPVVAPRPGHLALLLAAGVADGAIIETEAYGQVAVRGKTQVVEKVARVEKEADRRDPEREITKTVIRLKPSTTLSLLAADGTVVEMEGDEVLLDFIRKNKQSLASYLNRKFSPHYRFDLNGLAKPLNRIRLKGKYELYDAQKHVIAAILKGLEKRKGILLSGMMGTGKTAMGGTTAVFVGAMAIKAIAKQMSPEQVILIVCPPHLIDKWKREILSIQPKTYVEHLKRHEDIHDFMEKASLLGEGIPKIGLIKRDMTKLGCGFDAAVIWRKVPKTLWSHRSPTPEGYLPEDRIQRVRKPFCPHCGQEVMRQGTDGLLEVSETWLKSGKRDCLNCHHPLWQESRDSASAPKAGEKFPRKNPRYRLDQYLKKVYPERVFLLIWDEIHECANSDTGNGEAFGRMAGIAQKVLTLTGTPFNGRSSSLFNLEYHLNERVRQAFPWGGAERLSRKERGSAGYQAIVEGDKRQKGRAESRWVEQMGVREQVVEERPEYDSQTGAYTGTTSYQRPYEEAPGISPLLVAELMDHCVFFSLADLGKALPEYQEIAYPVKLDADVAECYDNTRSYLKEYLTQRRWEGDTSFRGAYLQWSMGWVNATFRPMEIIHNIRNAFSREVRSHVVKQLPSFGDTRIFAKEQALIDLLNEKLSAGRPCVVFLRQTATKDIQPRIECLIRQHVPLAKPVVLKNSVQAERREKVIDAEIAKGMNILLCNPELIKTGLDLVHFPTLIFFEIVFNLGTMMQAAARSYRLNQTAKLCETYYLYAQGTMEETAVHLMSRKQRAAKLLTGDIGLSGLDALTEGEGSFEEALLEAIAHEDSLIDPRELFQKSKELDAEDAEDLAFWNVSVEASESALEIISMEASDSESPLFRFAASQAKLVAHVNSPSSSPQVSQRFSAWESEDLTELTSFTSQNKLVAKETSPMEAKQAKQGFTWEGDELRLDQPSSTPSHASPKTPNRFTWDSKEGEGLDNKAEIQVLKPVTAATDPGPIKPISQPLNLLPKSSQPPSVPDRRKLLLEQVRKQAKLATHLNPEQQVALAQHLLKLLEEGVRDRDGQVKIAGLKHAEFLDSDLMQSQMQKYLSLWLQEKAKLNEDAQTCSEQILAQAISLYTARPLAVQSFLPKAKPVALSSSNAKTKSKNKSKADLLRLPETVAAQQLAMF